MAYAKYHLYKQQISHDGYTWEDTGIEVASGEVISIYDTLEECRGITPSSFEGKIKLTYSSGQTYSAECDSTSAVTYADTNVNTRSAMTSAIVGNCVTQILHGPNNRHSPFRQCSGLTSVLLPSSLRFIDDYSFAWCVSLTGITIPSGVTSIGTNEILQDGGGDERGAFYDCRALADVYIPKTVTTIGKCAFMSCSGLTSIDIPDSVTTIGSRAFCFCGGLTSITIPSGVTTIGDSTFWGCSGLTSVVIPSGVTSIGSYAFNNCSSLTTVNIPSRVTTIGDFAFYTCTSLTSIICNATTPPTCGVSAFYGTNDCPIYVPASAVDAYKSATNWSRYSSRIQAMP